MKSVLSTIALLGLGILGTHQANASIITQLVSTVAVVGGTAFTYRADLTNDQRIDTSLNPAFGTVYDFGPIIGTITSTGLLNSNFTFTTALTSIPAFQTAPNDSPSLLNIRFTANAGTTIAPLTSLGTFTVNSSSSGTRLASFDGQATKNAPGLPADGTITGNVGSVTVPTGVPEPGTVLSLGSGLLAAGFFLRRKKR